MNARMQPDHAYHAFMADRTLRKQLRPLGMLTTPMVYAAF
jgi:hypothetical protein